MFQLRCIDPILDEQGEKEWSRIGDIIALCDGARDPQPWIGQIDKMLRKQVSVSLIPKQSSALSFCSERKHCTLRPYHTKCQFSFFHSFTILNHTPGHDHTSLLSSNTRSFLFCCSSRIHRHTHLFKNPLPTT